MPIIRQQQSRRFKDISLSFKRHPITNDIIPLKNEDAIKRSVQNLVRIEKTLYDFDAVHQRSWVGLILPG